MMDILVWLSLATPIVLIGYLLYRGLKWLFAAYTEAYPTHKVNYVHTDPPADYVEPKTTMTTTAVRKPVKPNPNDPSPLKELNVGEEPVVWTSIDEASFLQDEEPSEPMDAGVRVWRVYRSLDGQSWVELDPALTERSACNYATYIKKQNPTEFVRVNDPEGIIVSYE